MPARKSPSRGADGLANLAEQLTNRVIKPLNLVALTRERIQETLDEFAEQGRITRSDADELAAELFRRGRMQTDSLLADLEKLVGRGRQQLGSATRRARQPVERLVRGGEGRRRGATGGTRQGLPISGYDEMTARQVAQALEGLTPAQLRKVRHYERRHANRKSVLASVDKLLA